MIVVTGGAGFIGSNFVLDWLANPKAEGIINLDKLTYAGNLSTLAPLAKDPRHIFIKGDIGDSTLVANLLQQHRPRATLLRRVHLQIDTHHRARQAKLIEDDDSEEDDVLDADPVLDLPSSEGEDDEEDEDDDDDEEDDDDDDASDDGEEVSRAARAREEGMLSAWGKQRGAYHGGDADVEIDDDAAADEEAEALRLQRKRAHALNEDDIAFGYSSVAAPPSKTSGSGKKASATGALTPGGGKSNARLAAGDEGAAAGIAAAIHKSAPASSAKSSAGPGAKALAAAAATEESDASALAALELAMGSVQKHQAGGLGPAGQASGGERVAKRVTAMSRQAKLDVVVSGANPVKRLLFDTLCCSQEGWYLYLGMRCGSLPPFPLLHPIRCCLCRRS